ncbi:alkaline phosphatase family protein [Frigoribacterium sp. 2-23]|uniref:alkaline phosphatase family protein n=1 Tax=Frigoribacterium sp. 2-23 TaxID=3415006 RepID=UPI003C704CC9
MPAARSSIVVLVDGLGASSLSARRGHARALTAGKGTLWSGFPSTTAAALATLTTGALPGEHGLVGYTVLDPENDRVVKQLSGWDAKMRPADWPRRRPLFDSVPGVRSHVVAAGRYRSSGLTQAILSGAEFVVADAVEDRFARAFDIVSGPGASLVYLYIPELDMTAHRLGWESSDWTAALETVDACVRGLADRLPADAGMLVTADHGVIDVSERRRIVFGGRPELVAGVRHVAGDPRVLQLHFDPGADDALRQQTVDAWRAAESERAWVATRDEAVAAGWFGPVDPVVLPRIGDLIIAARKGVVYYDGRSNGGLAGDMIGQHGSWSSEETQVPLRLFGAYSA